MINNHYYSVDKRYGVLRFCTTALFVLAGLGVLYALYQLLDSAPKGGKNLSQLEFNMQELAFEGAKYMFYIRLAMSAVVALVAMVLELLLGMEENQRELVELNKIRIKQEDNREITENAKTKT